MAKLPQVKCLYCGISFSRENTEYEQVGRRYAHKGCHEVYLKNQTKEEKDKQEFYAYLKQLFGQYNYTLVKRTAERFEKENDYTYEGMRKALYYFYEVKKNSTDKANGNIGIIPWVYNEANNYFATIENANKINSEKVITPNFNTERVIKIPVPKADKPKKRKFFNFLNKGEE